MTEHVQPNYLKKKSRLMALGALMGGLALILLIALVTMLIMKAQPAQVIDTSKYQVVYMTNGQAYFGKLQNTTGDFLVMRSPYVAQNVSADDKAAANSTQATLLKVTTQMYGPEDSIALKSSQVTFWQNLRDDSKVSTAIKSKE